MQEIKASRKLTVQFILFFIVLLLASIGLGTMLYKAEKSIWPQFLALLLIAILFLFFFIYSLVKLDQTRHWVQYWSEHPLWVLAVFLLIPIILFVFLNLSSFASLFPGEFYTSLGKVRVPNFLFSYFWEAIIFSIAFWFHPSRKKFSWKMNGMDIFTGILTGLASWCIAMFVSEIIQQQSLFLFPYQESKEMIWMIVPFALIIIPIGVGFYFGELFVSLKHNYQVILWGIIFCIIPLRIISFIPAVIFVISTIWLVRKKQSQYVMILAYIVFNTCMLLLNWQAVI